MLTPFCTLMALHSLLSYIANPSPTLRVVVMAVFHQQVRKSPAYTRELILYGSVKKTIIAARFAVIYVDVSQLFLKDCQV